MLQMGFLIGILQSFDPQIVGQALKHLLWLPSAAAYYYKYVCHNMTEKFDYGGLPTYNQASKEDCQSQQ